MEQHDIVTPLFTAAQKLTMMSSALETMRARARYR